MRFSKPVLETIRNRIRIQLPIDVGTIANMIDDLQESADKIEQLTEENRRFREMVSRMSAKQPTPE